MKTTRLYVDGALVATDIHAHDLAGRLREQAGDDTFAWIDLTTDGSDELARLAETLELHALAVEDALSPHERPKLARFDTHLLLTVSHSAIGDDGSVDLARLTAFITKRLVVTVRDAAFPIERVRQRTDENADFAAHGVAFIVWALLDVVVDDHISTLNELDDVSEALSRELFEASSDILTMQQRAFVLRRSIARLRHATIPLREVVTSLVRRETLLVPPAMQPYFADVYDHTLHAADWTESLRDQVASILETNVALQGNRMNEIMKKVTSWAAIIAVPTAITGFFGQNLAFPGFGTEWGFLASVGIIVASGFGLWAVFRRNDWL